MFLNGVPLLDEVGGDNELLVALFQMTFAIITPALIIGATVNALALSAFRRLDAVGLRPVAHVVCGGLLSGDSVGCRPGIGARLGWWHRGP